MNENEMTAFYMEQNENSFNLLENEYLIIYDSDNHPSFYCYQDGQLRQFHGGSLSFEIKKDKGELD